MKNVIIVVILAVFSFGANQAKAQDSKKTATIEIKTSAQCGMCKERLEKAMAFEKGVISSDLNVDNQVFTIKYKTQKTTPEKIKHAISKVGYDADDVPADQNAHDKLPGCCQKGGHK